jgi:hypothetical protein
MGFLTTLSLKELTHGFTDGAAGDAAADAFGHLFRATTDWLFYRRGFLLF